MADRVWLVEHRYRAVMEVRDGSPVTEVALRYGVSRQTVYAWRGRFERDGLAGLEESSRRPRSSPSRIAADIEALICELRRVIYVDNAAEFKSAALRRCCEQHGIALEYRPPGYRTSAGSSNA